MSRQRHWSVRPGPWLTLVGTATLAAVLGLSQPADEPDPLPFRLHPLDQAPAFSIALDPAGTGAGLDSAPDPHAARLTRWLREQLAPRSFAATNSADEPGAHLAAARQQAALARLQGQSGGDVEVRFRPVNGTPLLIKGRPLERRFSGIAKAGADLDELTARNFLRANAVLLRLEDPDQELQVVARERDHLGHQHLRFRQQYKGLPVWPAELKVHLDAVGDVYLLDGAFVPTPSGVPTTPNLTGEQAIQSARETVVGGALAEASPPELVIYAPLDRPARLAWKFDLILGLASAWQYLLDAENGAVLARISLCPHGAAAGSGVDGLGNVRPLTVWQEGNTYFMVDTSKPMFDRSSTPPNNARGAIGILDARNQPPTDRWEVLVQSRFDLFHVTSASATSGWVPDAVGAAFGLSQTYDYYLQRHSRNSLDDQGSSLVGVVRLGLNFPNAFWNGASKVMYFGDGYTRALDVCGHELTHGVINSLGNGGILNYHNQPGALNEAFADILGEMVEAYTRGSRPDWLKGDGLPSPFPVQNYANPNALSQMPGRPNPARMSQFVQLPDTREGDHGGVHINSSIINHCFYLLAEGLEGAIGLHDAERIFYRALSVHLDKESQFIDARHACVNAAESLFGVNSPQARMTVRAFDAVEIFDAPGTPDPSPVPTVPSADSTLALRLNPQAGQYDLVRYESARGDHASGTFIDTVKYLAPRRVAVTGDGTLALYVTSDNDLGMVETDGSNPRVAGHPGLVHSLAVAPDGKRFAFVLLNQAGKPTKNIRLVDLAAETERDIRLYAPGTEGARLDIIRFADAMDFTADGQILIYDAYAEIPGPGGQVFGGWTLYALDLRTDTIRALVDLNEGLDFGNPSLGNTRNHLLTFEVVNKTNGVSTVFAADLASNQVKPLATINPPDGLGVPGYTGDDRAIVYAQGDNSVTSGFSLVRQPLAADGITPSGQASVWMRDADVGVIYRRGQFVSTNRPPTAAITSPNPGQSFNAPETLTIQATASDPDGSVARVEFYQGSTRLGEDTTAPYAFTWNHVPAGRYRLSVRAFDNLGAAADSAPVEILVTEQAAKPDLFSPVINVTPSPVEEGQTLTLTATLKNGGQAPAPPSRARAFLSPGNDFDTQDDFVFPTFVSVPALAPDQEFQAVWTAPMPNLGSGLYDYWPMVQVDSDNVIDEADEGNFWKRNNPLQARDPAGQPPQITTQPQNVTVAEGQTATFSAQVSGSPAPTLQWQRSTDSGTTWNDLSDGSGISGSRSTGLSLAGVTSSMNGHRFRLRAVNAAGEAVSQPATLTVAPAQDPRHPADINPPDNRLTQQEVIAYAAAYKRGETWPEGPNPIPLDYMVRAAALYLRGETYRRDPGIASPPLWWVNTTEP